MPSASPYHQTDFHETSIYCEGDEASFLNLASPQTHTPVEAATASNSSDIDMADEAPRTYATLETQRRSTDTESQMMYSPYMLEPSDIKILKKDVFLTSLCADSSDSQWAHRMPEQWSVEDVISWIYDVTDRYRIDPNRVFAENFNKVNGQMLCNMSLEEFENCDGENGKRFYDCLQELRIATSGSVMPSIVKLESNPHNINSINNEFEPISGSDSDNETILPSIIHHNQRHSFSSHRSNDYSSTCALAGSDKSSSFTAFNLNSNLSFKDYCDYPQTDQLPVVKPLDSYARLVRDFNNNDIQKKRGPGRPRKHPIDGGMAAKLKRKPENEDKVLLWKFLRDRLLDDSCNPRIIKWEDHENGIFRIVSSSEVSRLWGNQKKNTTMNYEKMSRAIRFCRDKAFFSEMPKDGNFPKKLCFKFGEKATGWQ